MDATQKRKMFAAAYVVDFNGKSAAIAAGYSPKTAKVAGSRLLTHPEVQAEIERLHRERQAESVHQQEPVDFLLSVMRDQRQAPELRVRAAIAAAQYRSTKTGDGGKKEATADRAKKAASGRFGARPAPLKLVGRG